MKNINKDCVKSIIIDLRKSGKSFQEISDILKNDYGIVRSRQAVRELYKRSVDSSKQDALLIHDIITYHILGMNYSNISKKVNISAYRVKHIIQDNIDTYNTIYSEFRKTTKIALQARMNIGDIQYKLKYNGELPSSLALNNLIQDATIDIVKESELNILANIFNQTNSKKSIDAIANSLEIDMKDVMKLAKQIRNEKAAVDLMNN